MSDATRSVLRRSSVLLVPSLALALAFCARSEQETTPETAMPAAPPAAEAPSAPSVALSSPQVVEILWAADSSQIVTGRLAERKAENPQVKAFGQRMVQEHGALQDSLRALEKSMNMQPAPSSISQQIDQQTASDMAKFESLSGAEFDQAYMRSMVQVHQDVLQLIDSQLLPATAQDAQLNNTITQMVRPIIVGHLQAAQQIEQSLTSGSTGTR